MVHLMSKVTKKKFKKEKVGIKLWQKEKLQKKTTSQLY